MYVVMLSFLIYRCFFTVIAQFAELFSGHEIPALEGESSRDKINVLYAIESLASRLGTRLYNYICDKSCTQLMYIRSPRVIIIMVKEKKSKNILCWRICCRRICCRQTRWTNCMHYTTYSIGLDTILPTPTIDLTERGSVSMLSCYINCLYSIVSTLNLTL